MSDLVRCICTFVIAPTRQVFLQVCRDRFLRPDVDAAYVNSEKRLLGVRHARVLLAGCGTNHEAVRALVFATQYQHLYDLTLVEVTT